MVEKVLGLPLHPPPPSIKSNHKGELGMYLAEEIELFFFISTLCFFSELLQSVS